MGLGTLFILIVVFVVVLAGVLLWFLNAGLELNEGRARRRRGRRPRHTAVQGEPRSSQSPTRSPTAPRNPTA
jgi:hypothetical protein